LGKRARFASNAKSPELRPTTMPSTSCTNRAFGHNKHRPQIERTLPPFWGGERGPPSNTKSPGPRPSSIPSDILIHAAIWTQLIWAENWGLCPFGRRGAGSPSKTMWPGPRPTCMPSFILIRPTVCPQCTNVTNRQDRTDRQRSDSIGQTVLQTVAQKPLGSQDSTSDPTG